MMQTGHHYMMLQDFKRRFFVSFFLTVPLLILSPTLQDIFGVSWHFTGDQYVRFMLATILFFYGGKPFLLGLYKEVKRFKPGMMTLIGLSITVAYLYSAAVVFFISGPIFFWELATLINIMLLGHWIEMRSVMGASKALQKLAALMPVQAHIVLANGAIKDIPTADVKKGNIVLVRPGEKVSADGVIIEGESELNEAALTGESKLRFKKKGDSVIAGALNEVGSLTIRVQKDQKNNYISQVISLVKETMASKSQAQNIADKAAFALTIIAISAGVVTLISWLYITGIFSFALERMVSVMVITCPHALGLAIPLVVAAITTISAGRGLLIKNRTAFEDARNVTMVVFDKTGTLTEGAFKITDVVSLTNISADELLVIAASLEQHAKHSIAQAIIKKTQEEQIDLVSVQEVQTIVGKGITGKIANETYFIGKPSLLTDFLVKPNNLDQALQKLKVIVKEAKTAFFVSTATEVIGIIAVADVIRKSSLQAVDMLHKQGIKVAMITGDNKQTAQIVAQKLGIDTVLAEVLPHEKASEIKKLQQEGFIVSMVGDGINDAPALVASNVGIALGAGTDVAIESADVVLVQNDPKQVVDIIDLSRTTYKKMIQNLLWATGYNIFAIPLAAGVFYNYGIMIDPAFGALLMTLSTVVVAINAQLLYLKKK